MHTLLTSLARHACAGLIRNSNLGVLKCQHFSCERAPVALCSDRATVMLGHQAALSRYPMLRAPTSSAIVQLSSRSWRQAIMDRYSRLSRTAPHVQGQKWAFHSESEHLSRALSARPSRNKEVLDISRTECAHCRGDESARSATSCQARRTLSYRL